MTRTAHPSPSPRTAKPAAAAAAAVPAPTSNPLDELDALLRQLIAEHESLLALAADHRRAIAQADLNGLSAAVSRQQAGVQRIAALEQRRAAIATLVAPPNPTTARSPRTTAQASPSAPTPTLTISGLAALAPEPTRGKLLALGQSLRDLINRLHAEHRVIREAAASLSSHMEGLMRQVYRKLSHAGTYARAGAAAAEIQVVSALDVRS